MIGNDIIDLSIAMLESNPMRKGWMEKIFSEGERQCINESDEKFLAIWKLWAAKEAVYKAHVRQSGITGFYPSKIKCDLQEGLAHVSDRQYYFTIRHHCGIICAWAAPKNELLKRIRIISKDDVIKVGGMPYYWSGGGLWPASVSHHGDNYQAVTIEY